MIAARHRTPTVEVALSTDSVNSTGSPSESRSQSDFESQSVEIVDDHGDPVRFELRLPSNRSTDPLPVLVILAGIKTGHQTLERLPEAGDNALIAYSYPYDREAWRVQSNLRRGLISHRMTARVSAQLAALMEWLRHQTWSDRERITLAGGSLGAIVLPMILRELQTRGLAPRRAVFAYGGAGRFTLGYLSLRHRSKLLASAGAVLAWLFLGRLEPARHLPYLEGEFLLISSLDDTLVPRRCSALFERLTPEPKTIVHMQGEHVDSRQSELLAAVVETARRWLAERDAFR